MLPQSLILSHGTPSSAARRPGSGKESFKLESYFVLLAQILMLTCRKCAVIKRHLTSVALQRLTSAVHNDAIRLKS